MIVYKRFSFILAFLLILSSVCLANVSGLTIVYENNAQFELTNPEGTRVLIDVTNPSILTAPAQPSDILLTTHTHYDHVNAPFLEKFQGKQLFVQAGELDAPGVKITGIASAHYETEDFSPKGGSDYIYLVEMGGLRIAHFGDIGQKSLTADQLKALGEVDILLTQISNSYSDMSLVNLKGFKIIDQVKPKLVIPAHADNGTLQYAAKNYPAFWLDGPLTITKNQLPTQTSFLLMASWGDYAKTNKLGTKWPLSIIPVSPNQSFWINLMFKKPSRRSRDGFSIKTESRITGCVVKGKTNWILEYSIYYTQHSAANFLSLNNKSIHIVAC
jgi:hypothetical protein